MINPNHKINRIQMKWFDRKYVLQKPIRGLNNDGLVSIAFIDTQELQRMKALVSKEGNMKRGFYTNSEWFSVIDTELKYRSKKVNTIAYSISEDINKITSPSRSSISNILKQILEVQD